MLPLPIQGQTDLELIKWLFTEIQIPGLDMNREVIKAVRKFPSKPPPNQAHPPLGTVLVEMKSEDSRSKVMRSKLILQRHPNMRVRSVIIKNMKSKELSYMENLGNSLLRKIPGCESFYVAPNGHIREKSLASNQHLQSQAWGAYSSQCTAAAPTNTVPFQHQDQLPQQQPPNAQQYFQYEQQ